MAIKNFGKRIYTYMALGASALSMILSAPFTAKAAEEEILGNIKPKTSINLEIPYNPKTEIGINLKDLYDAEREKSFANASGRQSELERKINLFNNFSERKLLNAPHIFAAWYAADAIMVAVHEWGHNDEAFKQGLYPGMTLTPKTFWVNGNSNYDGNPANKKDEARINSGGFMNAGKLAEFLRSQIMLYGDKMSPEELRFMSMLAFVSEANLPFYLGQYYTGTTLGDNGDDVGNFSENSGISPDMMLTSSAAHLLLNAPYIYRLARNAVGSDPMIPRARRYDVSLGYDGNSWRINLHMNPDVFEEKLEDSIGRISGALSLPAMRK